MKLKKVINFIKPIVVSIPFAIIVASIVIAGGLVEVQEKKQSSIEKQQAEKLKIEKKNNCLDIYQVESKKWNNVNGWSYDTFWDSCAIEYKAKDGTFFTKYF